MEVVNVKLIEEEVVGNRVKFLYISLSYFLSLVFF